MDDETKKEQEYLRIGIQEAYLCSEFVVKYLDKGKERDDNLEILEKLVQNYCLLDNHLKIRPDILASLSTEVQTKFSQAENAESPELVVENTDYAKIINDRVSNAIKKVKLNDHTKLAEYKKKVSKLISLAEGTGGEEELTVTEESDNLIDPISKTTLVDPVISLKCRHRYSRKHILNHLSGSSQCPYVGCRMKITVEDLEDDVITAHTLRRLQLLQTHC